jgi:hypothetical protein
VKTVRFSEVVKRSGAPEAYLVLMQPAKDKALQSAIKAHRVMTVIQQNTGAKTDFGKVGFEEGGSRQFLIFPKSLRTFDGCRVVGIKYDLLSSREIPKSQQAKPPKQPKAKPKPPRKPEPRTGAPSRAKSAKVVEFPLPSRAGSDQDDDLQQVKRLARQALRALEQGKQVPAFHLLKRIIAL